MSDLLTRLAEHALDRTSAVQPRLPSRFEEPAPLSRPSESWPDTEQGADHAAEDSHPSTVRRTSAPASHEPVASRPSGPAANRDSKAAHSRQAQRLGSLSRSTDGLIDSPPESSITVQRANPSARAARSAVVPPARPRRLSPSVEQSLDLGEPSRPPSDATRESASPVLLPPPRDTTAVAASPSPEQVAGSTAFAGTTAREASDGHQGHRLAAEPVQYDQASRPLRPELPLKRHRAPILKRESAAEIMRSVREPASPEPTSVEVRIGRIEVRAVAKDSPRRAPAPNAKRVLGLDEYFERRPGEKGRR